MFWDVHNPDSSSYQKFMDISEIDSLIKPDDYKLHSVIHWLNVNQIKVTNQ